MIVGLLILHTRAVSIKLLLQFHFWFYIFINLPLTIANHIIFILGLKMLNQLSLWMCYGITLQLWRRISFPMQCKSPIHTFSCVPSSPLRRSLTFLVCARYPIMPQSGSILRFFFASYSSLKQNNLALQENSHITM